jgi:hypothetical protein
MLLVKVTLADTSFQGKIPYKYSLFLNFCDQ